NRATTASHAGASSEPPRIIDGSGAPDEIRGGAKLAPAWVREASSVAGSDGNGQIQDTPGPGGVSVHSGHPLGASLRNRVLAVAAALACRDFAGVASLTLASIYLQKAHGFDTRRAGFTVGAMMLIG